MRAITLELYPNFLIDILYAINKIGEIIVISGSINGINIKLTNDQKDILSEEIAEILEFDNNNLDDNLTYSIFN